MKKFAKNGGTLKKDNTVLMSYSLCNDYKILI